MLIFFSCFSTVQVSRLSGLSAIQAGMFHPKASNKCPRYRAAELLSVTRTLYPPENMSVPHKYLEGTGFLLRVPWVKNCCWFSLAGKQPWSLCAHTKQTGHILAVHCDSAKRRRLRQLTSNRCSPLPALYDSTSPAIQTDAVGPGSASGAKLLMRRFLRFDP